MTKFTIDTEQGPRVLNDPDEAKVVIAATATAWMVLPNEVQSVELFKDIARAMNLDLRELQYTPSEHPNDFPYKYFWVTQKKYVKRPIEVTAWQFYSGDPVPEWVDLLEDSGDIQFDHESGNPVVHIFKEQGKLTLAEGDFLINGGDGDIYPCEETIFNKTYEEVK